MKLYTAKDMEEYADEVSNTPEGEDIPRMPEGIDPLKITLDDVISAIMKYYGKE
jgi:hypothetical protein